MIQIIINKDWNFTKKKKEKKKNLFSMVQWIWTGWDESFFDAVPGIDLRCSRGRIGVMVAVMTVVVMAVTSLMETVKEDGEVKFKLSVERKGWVIWVGMERKGMKEEG